MCVHLRRPSALRHLTVRVSLPDQLYITAVVLLDDVVQPPQHGQQVEHHQEARVVVLAGPGLGELQLTNCALRRRRGGGGRGEEEGEESECGFSGVQVQALCVCVPTSQMYCCRTAWMTTQMRV